MTYGEPGRGHPVWSLGEEESRPLIKHALEAGINFFDTANMYSQGSSEEILGRALNDFADRDDVVIATKVRHPDAPGPERRRACRARRSLPRSTTACAGSAPTTSTCTRSTAWTTRPRSRRRSRRCTTSCKAGKARYLGASSMHAWEFSKALHLQRAARLGAVRLDAGPLQPARPRGGARDAAAVRRRGDRHDRVEPARPRPPRPRPRTRRPGRSASDPFADMLYTAGGQRPRDHRRGRVDRQRPAASAGRRSRWPGCGATRSSSPRSSARPRPSHIDDAVASLEIELTDDEVARARGALHAALRLPGHLRRRRTRPHLGPDRHQARRHMTNPASPGPVGTTCELAQTWRHTVGSRSRAPASNQ